MWSYWPWWAGAIAFGVITVGYYLATGHTIGVSGAWERVIHWRREREVERMDAMVVGTDLDAVLLAETLAEFGTAEVTGVIGAPGATERTAGAAMAVTEALGATGGRPVVVTAAAPPAPTPPAPAVPRPRPGAQPVASQALFLASIFVGGLLAAALSGRFAWRTDMGQAFREIVVDGPAMWPVLFVGGVLVGVGTRLAGGCSSGHGLSGCSRFQPASILATAVFFGTGVAVSMLLWKVI